MLSNLEITGLKKFQGQPKCGLIQFGCQRNFLKQNKTKQHSQQQEAKSVRRQTAISQQDFFLEHCHKDFALIG